MKHLRMQNPQNEKCQASSQTLASPTKLKLILVQRIVLGLVTMTTTTLKEERNEPQVVVGDDEKVESTSNAPTLHEPAQDEPRTKPEDGKIATEEEEHEHEWVTGWKLASMMISLTLAAFLMLLDMSIISTVRAYRLSYPILSYPILSYPILSYPSVITIC
jgi:hypothetical protein